MADVQVEDGYTRIANILLEKIASSKLNGCQNAIVLMVWRYTYGFNRKEHDLSAGFIAKATGYNKRQIEREISSLVSMKILNQRVVNGVSRTLAFNKDFETWTPGKLADGVKADGKSTDGETADTPPANKPTVTPGKLADQEIHSFKNKFKDSTTGEFEKVVSAFRELHRNVIDFPMADCSLLTGFIEQGISADFIIEIMNEKYKPSVKVFRFYKDAITERHVNKDRVLPTGRKRNEPDWEKIKKQLEDAEREFKPGA